MWHSFSCFVAGSDCVAEFGVFSVFVGIHVCEIVYLVLYMAGDIQCDRMCAEGDGGLEGDGQTKYLCPFSW